LKKVVHGIGPFIRLHHRKNEGLINWHKYQAAIRHECKRINKENKAV
jgi:hypothetical protein